MRFKTNKTWSQQQLAAKLRVDSHQGLLSWERRRLVIHAAKTALAAALCWWLAMRFGLHDGYWGAISAIIVLQSNVGSTVNASRVSAMRTPRMRSSVQVRISTRSATAASVTEPSSR